MEHAGAVAKRYLEWAKQQAEKAKQEQQKPNQPSAEMRAMLGVKR